MHCVHCIVKKHKCHEDIFCISSLLQMYIDLTGPTVTAISLKYDPHKKIVPLLAALYHTWVFIKRYFVDFQISRCLLRALEICKLAKRQSGKVIATKTYKFMRGMKTVENGDFFGWWGTFRWGGLMDLLVQHTKAPPLWNKFLSSPPSLYLYSTFHNISNTFTFTRSCNHISSNGKSTFLQYSIVAWFQNSNVWGTGGHLSPQKDFCSRKEENVKVSFNFS